MTASITETKWVEDLLAVQHIGRRRMRAKSIVHAGGKLPPVRIALAQAPRRDVRSGAYSEMAMGRVRPVGGDAA